MHWEKKLGIVLTLLVVPACVFVMVYTGLRFNWMKRELGMIVPYHEVQDYRTFRDGFCMGANHQNAHIGEWLQEHDFYEIDMDTFTIELVIGKWKSRDYTQPKYIMFIEDFLEEQYRQSKGEEEKPFEPEMDTGDVGLGPDPSTLPPLDIEGEIVEPTEGKDAGEAADATFPEAEITLDLAPDILFVSAGEAGEQILRIPPDGRSIELGSGRILFTDTGIDFEGEATPAAQEFVEALKVTLTHLKIYEAMDLVQWKAISEFFKKVGE